MKKTSVVIADDHPILRDGLRKLLETEQDFAVVGDAVDGHGAVEVTRRIEPNILLLDLAMPGLPGLEVLRALNGVPLATRDSPDGQHRARRGRQGAVARSPPATATRKWRSGSRSVRRR